MAEVRSRRTVAETPFASRWEISSSFWRRSAGTRTPICTPGAWRRITKAPPANCGYEKKAALENLLRFPRATQGGDCGDPLLRGSGCRGLVSVRDPPALPGRHAEFDSSGIEMGKLPT